MTVWQTVGFCGFFQFLFLETQWLCNVGLFIGQKCLQKSFAGFLFVWEI